jgi:hypothetical protein
MKKSILGATGKQWLKSIHLTFSLIWLGAAICMNVLRFAWMPIENGDLYAVDHTVVLLDHWVILPAALGALLTGLLESWLTTWGFFKYRWVTVKWAVTVAAMLFAPLFQAQWAQEMASISSAEGLLALQNPAYLRYRLLYSLCGLVLIFALSILPIISVLKPWLKQDKLKGLPRRIPPPPSTFG